MTKRNLFAELKEGIEAMSDERAGKITLRKHSVEYQAAPQVTAEKVLSVRDKLNVSRAVFARYLRTNPRTVEGWSKAEQSRICRLRS